MSCFIYPVRLDYCQPWGILPVTPPSILWASLYVSLNYVSPPPYGVLIDLPPIPGLINFRAASINYYPFLSQFFFPFFFLPPFFFLQRLVASLDSLYRRLLSFYHSASPSLTHLFLDYILK